MSSLLDKLVAQTGIGYSPTSRIANLVWKQGVSVSSEFRRIRELPRRELKSENLTGLFRIPGGSMMLWPIQCAALLEAEKANGLIAPIGVGHGKTLISLLVPFALKSKKTVLLVPPQLRDQLLEHDIPRLAKHFVLPNCIHVVAYSELSSARKADILERIAPDLIVADEAHHLRHKSSARTKRFLRYFKEHPETRLVALSGTITSKSVRDYAHLARLALRDGSPVPTTYQIIEEWASALDVSDFPMPPGALQEFCAEGESVREGFRRRCVETSGWVSTAESALGTSLIIRALKPEVPKPIASALRLLRNDWVIGSEDITDPMAFARVAKQVACGFYYRWDWPNNVVDREWLEARSNWNREVREKLKRSVEGMDSPLLLANAAKSGKWASEHWAAWEAMKERPAPPTVPVWIDYGIMDYVVEWAKGGGVIWYVHDAVGQALAARGLPVFGGDSDKELGECTAPAIACSITAHGFGKNLQRWNRNLIVAFPSNGSTVEQVLGRTHRPGQEADEVFVDWLAHTSELVGAYETACRDADYITESVGNKQKLSFATKLMEEV